MRRRSLGWGSPASPNLVSLVKSGKAYVKISVTADPRENYGYFTPLAQMLISANVDRILWGTNWPHPNSVDGDSSTPRCDTAVASRRRACAKSPAHLGAGRCGAQAADDCSRLAPPHSIDNTGVSYPMIWNPRG